MTPVADLRKMSLKADAQAVVRSRSDSSNNGLASVMADGRRSSDGPEAGDRQVVLRPLQLDNVDSGCLLYRRLSKTPGQSSRSYSIRSIKKYAEGRNRNRGSSIPCETCAEVKVKERTVSNRSLPLPGDETEFRRLRNFSVTSKGVINRGDSFRSKSMGNVPAFLGGPIGEVEGGAVADVVVKGPPSPVRDEPKSPTTPENKLCRVLLVGAHDVGKSALKKQFMTSEYICESGYSHDDGVDKIVTVVLNNEESEMEFEEETLQEENAYTLRMEIDAYVIVYSVTNRRSYLQAKHLLAEIEGIVDAKAVILVGNKTDLARLRAVTTDEAKSLAKEMGCKFIETSVAINHQVDELLVGTLTQVRIKAKMADKMRKKRESQPTNRRSSIYSGSKATGVLKRILKRACLKSKSCDNLHVL